MRWMGAESSWEGHDIDLHYLIQPRRAFFAVYSLERRLILTSARRAV